jgi:ABC-type multidrug transport system fused ATPase/permease subunit
VFGREQTFLKKFQGSADTNSSAQLNYISAQRWLSLRIELLGSVIVLIACVLVISLNDTLQISAGFAALLIIWSSNFTITLGFLVDTFSEAEAAITSIERVHAMCELPEEKPMLTDKSVDLPASWPQRGLVEFKDVKVRYREGLPLALNGLSFTVAPGERCGICGRTGAGKSTLTVALFRLVELESGSVLVDGVNLAKLGLSDVRGRLSIIPQDPFLLAGTLRDCLDPFSGSSDGDILEALKAVRVVGTDADTSALDRRVDEGGSNFSVGERQLLCLARALLAKPTVLVLDEATASVDGETDVFIQRMLRTRFKNTTLLTVAHRLHTIMDYDTILVMDGGKAAEYGSPKKLIEEKGLFANLVASTGEESARALREVALR